MGHHRGGDQLHVAAKHGRANGAREILATYTPTERSRPGVLAGLVGLHGDAATFRWALTSPFGLRPPLNWWFQRHEDCC
jgi:hypothetical protein